MSFFYDLNKRLATLASKQDQQHIAESAKVEAVAKSPFTQALNESKQPDANKNGISDYAEDGIGKMEEAGYSAKKAAAGKDIGKPGKNFAKIAKSAGKEYGSKAAGERVAGAVLNKLRHAKEGVEESASQQDWQKKYDAMMKTPHGRRAIAAAEKDSNPHSINKAVEKHHAKANEGNAFSGAVVKAKADGIQKGETVKVGNKTYPVKEADVVGLGEDEKMAEGVSRKHFQAIADTLKHIEDMDKRRELAQHHASAFKLANPRFDQKRFFQAAGIDEADMSGLEEGYAEMDAWLKSREKEKGTGKFDSRKTSTGTVYTRKPETFDDPETDPEATGGAPKRKGRPAGTKRAIGAKGPGVKSKLLQKGAIAEEHGKVCEYCGHAMSEEEIAEKAVSKKQQKFMGMVHAAQKGEKPASKEVAKVAKDMGKQDATDFASTKHKGLPEKVKAKKTEEGAKPDFLDVDKDGNKKEAFKKAVDDKKEKKVDETSAESKPNSSKGGMQFGKGVYESLDAKLETMISEGMNVSVNMNSDAEGDAQKSITVTATGADADKLADLLKMAGMESKQEETCPACGSSDCGCDSELEENSPDWPTKKETTGNNDANQRRWSGGLNGPKSTGQTTTPVIAHQGRQSSMEESVKLERNLFNLFQNYKAK